MKYNKAFMIILICFILLLAVMIIFREEIMHKLGISYKKIYNVNFSEEEVQVIEERLGIVDTELCWSGELKYNNNPKIIIFHHSAIEDMDVNGIDALHKSRGWIGIGYHYYITKDGRIYKGRPEEAEGAHTKGKNTVSIGICVEGNIEQHWITDMQRVSLKRLTFYLCIKYDIIDIIGHNDVADTLCPGRNFPKESIKLEVIDMLKKYKVDE